MPKKQITTPTMTPKRPAAQKKPISITIEPDVLRWVDERADNRSEQINGDLSRYYRMLAEIRPALREKLSVAELSLILDACNGWMMDFLAPAYLWMEVADAIRLHQLDAKWEVEDGANLVQRIRAMSWAETVTLADAITRWWHAVGDGDHTREPARALE